MTHRPPIHLAADRDVWDRQPGETQRQYARFRTYLELGRTRDLRQAVEILNATMDPLTRQYAYSLSYSYRWTERADAYDRDQARLERERLVSQRREMSERHRKLATGLQAKAVAALQQITPAILTPLDVARFLRLAVAIERGALGEPDQVVAVTGPGGGPVAVDDLSQYSPEERRHRLEAIASELARRAAADPADSGGEDE